MKRRLGVAETEAIRALYVGRLPGFTDLVCYWFERARELIENGQLARVGLVAPPARLRARRPPPGPFPTSYVHGRRLGRTLGEHDIAFHVPSMGHGLAGTGCYRVRKPRIYQHLLNWLIQGQFGEIGENAHQLIELVGCPS